MFASFQSKGATSEDWRVQNSIEKKLPPSKAADLSSHNPYHDLLMIFQQRNSSVQIRFANIDGYFNVGEFLRHSRSANDFQFNTSFPSHFRSIGLLLIFPKHYFL